MMEVMDESTLEEELKEADKVDWSSLSLSDLDLTHKAPASRVPWNLVGLGVGVCAAFLLVVICCDIKVQIVPRMLHCRLDWLLA